MPSPASASHKTISDPWLQAQPWCIDTTRHDRRSPTSRGWVQIRRARWGQSYLTHSGTRTRSVQVASAEQPNIARRDEAESLAGSPSHNSARSTEPAPPLIAGRGCHHSPAIARLGPGTVVLMSLRMRPRQPAAGLAVAGSALRRSGVPRFPCVGRMCPEPSGVGGQTSRSRPMGTVQADERNPLEPLQSPVQGFDSPPPPQASSTAYTPGIGFFPHTPPRFRPPLQTRRCVSP